MVDIRLISILPQTPVKGVAVPQGMAGGGDIRGIAGLDAGTTLSGFIINRDPQGNPVLRTESGDIAFASHFFLKIGSEVVIRIDTGAGQPLARILTVDGEPPEVAEQKSAFAGQPEVVVRQPHRPPSLLVALNASVPAQNPPADEAAITLFGTLIQPQSGVPPHAAPAVFPAGTHLTLRLVSIASPAAAPPPPAAASSSPLPSAPMPTPSPPAGTAAPANYATYRRAAAQPQAMLPPAAAAPQPAPPAAAAAAPEVPVLRETPAAPVSVAPYTRPSPLAAPVAPAAPAPVMAVPGAASADAADAAPRPVQNAAPSAAAPAGNMPLTPPPAASPPGSAAGDVSPPLPPPVAPTPPPITASPASYGPSAPVAVAAPQAPLPGQRITAQVIGHEPGGEALVQTPLGIVRLQPETALPAGSTLIFQMVQTTPPALSTLSLSLQGRPVSSQPAPLLELARHWSSLQQIFTLLAGRFAVTAPVPPPVNLPGLSTTGPAVSAAGFTPKDIGAGLLVFVAALRGGDFRNWLGRDHVRWLEDSGQGPLLQKAQAEWNGIATQYAETRPGQWQVLFFPVAVDGLPQQVRLFTKRERRQDPPARESATEDTRFVIEMDLTALGGIQMDGFVRKNRNMVHFDLVIRSQQMLKPQVQQDILAIYSAAGALTGYKGGLVFQTMKEFPVNPMEDIVAAHGSYMA